MRRVAVFCLPAGALGMASAVFVPDATILAMGAGLAGMGVRSVIRAERRRYNKS